MKASQQTIQQIERALRKVAGKFPEDAEPLFTDIHLLVNPYTGEIRTYNDDDEELDRFAGRAADDYTDEEVEEFSEVLYTMQPEEVAGWNRSLILRGINLPNQIKDEVISFLS